MSFLACNPASFPHLSPHLVGPANQRLSTRNFGGKLPPSYRGLSRLNRTLIGVIFRSQYADENFALARVCRCIPSFARSQLRGLSGARRRLVFCFAFCAPSGSRFLPKQV